MANEITPPSETTEPAQADVVARDSIVADDGLEAVEAPTEPAHFEDWDLNPSLMRALGDMGYDRPMPVQEAVFTTLTGGKDLMVQSKTGSGKTAAFGIPIAQMLSDGKKGVQSLILAPTRELALQVAKEIEKLVVHMDVAVVPIYGGAPIGPQIKKLEDGGQIVAGTPGRVLDHIRRGTMDTSGIRMLVLDECDEMLSMGFQEEIENIVSTLPAKEERQTMLFSATIPKEIERIGRRHMREPQMLTLSSDSVGAELIDHYYYVVSGMARNRDLLKLMKAEKPDSAIIFCNTRDETNTVARFLRKNGYDSEALSSDLSQSDRERVMGRMRDKNLNFLVATDIAARGIDISELSHVINYTFPASPEVYVHRSGRTGRAGKEGTALSLVGPREIGAFYYLKLIYKIIPTERDLPNADEMAAIEEGELYEQVTAMVAGDARKEHIALARRLWQSNEGERVVALLLQRLLTKTAAPAVEKTAPVAAQSLRPATQAPPSESSGTEAAEEERPRKRRRRRGQSETGASEVNGVESQAAQLSPEKVATEDVVAAASATADDVTVEPAVEAAKDATQDAETERPRRKRRRRRGQSEDVEASSETSVDTTAKSDDVSVAAPAEAEATERASEVEVKIVAEAEVKAVAETDAEASAETDVKVGAETEAEASAASDVKADAETEAEANAETDVKANAEAEAEASAESDVKADAETEAEANAETDVKADEPEAEERPRRKRRRRRGASNEDRETRSETAKAEEDDDAVDTQEVTRQDIEAKPQRKAKKKAVKGRARTPRTEAGAHLEFWEAWADSKSEPEVASNDDAESSSEFASEDSDDRPARKRRRRRRGSKESEEVQASEATTAETGDAEDTSTAEESAPSAEQSPEETSAPTVRLFVNVGKREDADVEAIRTFLGEALGDSADHLGRITLRNTHCYIRVAEESADEVIETCSGLVFHEREVVVERARAKR